MIFTIKNILEIMFFYYKNELEMIFTQKDSFKIILL